MYASLSAIQTSIFIARSVQKLEFHESALFETTKTSFLALSMSLKIRIHLLSFNSRSTPILRQVNHQRTANKLNPLTYTKKGKSEHFGG